MAFSSEFNNEKRYDKDSYNYCIYNYMIENVPSHCLQKQGF
jgi:hypothetical protein